jgi:hypothetical protein
MGRDAREAAIPQGQTVKTAGARNITVAVGALGTGSLITGSAAANSRVSAEVGIGWSDSRSSSPSGPSELPRGSRTKDEMPWAASSYLHMTIWDSRIRRLGEGPHVGRRR